MSYAPQMLRAKSSPLKLGLETSFKSADAGRVGSLEGDLCPKALAVPADGRNCECSACPHESDPAVARLQASGDLYAVPVGSVTHVANRHVVVRAPEKRHRIEALLETQDVASCGLPLPLR